MTDPLHPATFKLPRAQPTDFAFNSTLTQLQPLSKALVFRQEAHLKLVHTSTHIMATSVASKRLFHEYRTLSTDPPEGITAGPISEDDLFSWEALINGPDGSPFEGGIFAAELKFPKDYPLAPPTMKFLCDLWHPNGECALL